MIQSELTKLIAPHLPGARIEVMALPQTPQLNLYLLNADYPQHELEPEQVAHLMDNPLYWSFCWASGQVLASFLLANPEWVSGRRVLDFGCGSGVVAIAAAMAGAARVVACDIDQEALLATQLNAALNGAEVELAADFYDVEGEIDLIIVADVLYDRGNLPWLQRFVSRADEVLIADSRIKDFDFPPYRQIGQRDACTLPDLDESMEFRDVRLYHAAGTNQAVP